MTPELEAKARELDCWARRLAAYWPLGSWEKPERAQQRVEFFRGELELYTASQLSAERTWWITRIEQERDRYGHGYGGIDVHNAMDDLLTSVRERG